ncbi:MAG: hypothetical protein EZS28_054184, partial [Streblomastix strix]
QVKSSMKLPPISGSDLSMVAGIQLKHHPKDLVRTSAAFGNKTTLIAQAYSPTLIIDSSPLGVNQFVLNARVPTSQHFSFIHRCNTGLNSIFGGLHNNFLRKMYRNLMQLQSQPPDINTLQHQDAKQPEDSKEQVNVQKNEKADQNDEIIEIIDFEEQNNLHVEDFDDEYYLHTNDNSQSIVDLLELSPKSS